MPPPHDDDTVSLAALRELLGDENTLTLLEHYSGIRIKLPRLSITSWLVRALALANRRALNKALRRRITSLHPARQAVPCCRNATAGQELFPDRRKALHDRKAVYRNITEGKRIARQKALIKAVGDGKQTPKRTTAPVKEWLYEG